MIIISRSYNNIYIILHQITFNGWYCPNQKTEKSNENYLFNIVYKTSWFPYDLLGLLYDLDNNRFFLLILHDYNFNALNLTFLIICFAKFINIYPIIFILARYVTLYLRNSKAGVHN